MKILIIILIIIIISGGTYMMHRFNALINGNNKTHYINDDSNIIVSGIHDSIVGRMTKGSLEAKNISDSIITAGDVTGCVNGNSNVPPKNIGTLLKQYSIAVQHTAVSETDKKAVKYAVERMKKFAEKGILFCFINKDNLTFNTIEILKNQGVHVYYAECYNDIWHEMKHGIDKYFKTCANYILLTWSDDKLYNIIPLKYRRYSSYTIKIFIDDII